MPRFHLTDSQIADLTAALLSGERVAEPRGVKTPETVHFEPAGKKEQHGFQRLCGGCHRVLSMHHGGLGGGDVGPNLSGLFSPFYPKTAKDNGPWTETELKRWLKNPRQIRPYALMQPVEVTQRERGELVKQFRLSPEGVGK
jgi:cytochrome c2